MNVSLSVLTLTRSIVTKWLFFEKFCFDVHEKKDFLNSVRHQSDRMLSKTFCTHNVKSRTTTEFVKKSTVQMTLVIPTRWRYYVSSRRSGRRVIRSRIWRWSVWRLLTTKAIKNTLRYTTNYFTFISKSPSYFIRIHHQRLVYEFEQQILRHAIM